jgi:hypothetical protein
VTKDKTPQNSELKQRCGNATTRDPPTFRPKSFVSSNPGF